ncbi:MAG: 2-hydroxyacid dehydrogenase, partial [Pseudomonadota bacterium]
MSDAPRILLLGSPAARYVDRLNAGFAVTQAESAEAFEAALQNGAGVAGIAMFGHWKITPEVMDALPDLKVISNFGVGYDTIDADEAANRGILVSHTPEVLNDEVAD